MKRKPFNLLKPMQPPLTVWDKVYNWVTNQAKLVLMFVIILITVAFVAKVVVDTEAKSKTKELRNLMDQLSFYSQSVEPESRSNIRRVDVYSLLKRQSSNITPILEEVYRVLGSSSNELTVRIQDDRLMIYGTENLDLLRNLESVLRTSDNFSNVNFDSLSIQENDLDTSNTFGEYAVTAIIKKDVYIIDRLK